MAENVSMQSCAGFAQLIEKQESEQKVLSLTLNAMRELVSVSSGFRVAKVTVFRLAMAICIRFAEPGL